MKITIVQGAFLPVPPLLGGGIEKMWFGLGKEFVRRGHEVVHISRKYDQLPTTEIIEGVRHIRIKGYDAPKSKIIFRILDLLYALSVLKNLPAADLLITNTIWLPVLVRNSKRGKLYVHIARYPKGQMRFYRHAARLQTVSQPVADAIKNELPDEAGKIVAIPPFLLNNPPAIDFENTWNGRGRTLLYVGRIHPEKGVDLLLKAFGKLVLNNQLPWRLRIVGPTRINMGGGGDAYFDKLKTICQPFRENVEWFGFVSPEQLNQLYCESSLFVYPSVAERGETFGAAPLEAMSLGCPAIVSNLKCFSDFITNDKNGFVFDHRVAGPENELARRLLEVLSDTARLKKIAKAAYETTQAFKIERIAERYLADFDKVIREPIYE